MQEVVIYQVGRKYIVYDEQGYILILTTNKNVALHVYNNTKRHIKSGDKE